MKRDLDADRSAARSHARFKPSRYEIVLTALLIIVIGLAFASLWLPI